MSDQEKSSKFEKLREEAERLIQSPQELSSEENHDILELIHELRIHQAELEIQNEELRRTQQELSDLHREYEDLYEFAPCGYITLNNKGIITHINLTGINLIASDKQAALRQGLTSFIEAGYDDAFLSARRKAGETAEKQRIELPLKRKISHPLWVRADIEADLDGDGAVTQWRIALLDISKEKEAQARLLQSQKMESIGNLAGGIAHDFNNILYAVIGFTELALDDVEKGCSLEANLQEIYKASRRAKDLVTQILTFARKTNEEAKLVCVDTIAKDSIKLLRATIPQNIEIEQSINSEARLVCNPALLEQIFLNLTCNAADAMEEDGGKLKIAVSETEIDEQAASEYDLPGPGDYVQISISDTGVGISPDISKSIFEPYFTTKAFGKGTGMGLASVYGTVKKYGGAINFESHVSEGTIFTILLPANKQQKTIKPNPAEAAPHGSERILLVDDELAIVKMNSRLLGGLGYSVEPCTSSTKALTLFQAKPDDFDLVLTDMAMPNLTGDKLAVELMKIRPDIPVILCTGYSSEISDETASDIGIRALVHKPTTKTDMAKTIRNVLDETN